MNTNPVNLARRPSDPLLRAADAALRRAAVKAQERARQTKQSKRLAAPDAKTTR